MQHILEYAPNPHQFDDPDFSKEFRQKNYPMKFQLQHYVQYCPNVDHEFEYIAIKSWIKWFVENVVEYVLEQNIVVTWQKPNNDKSYQEFLQRVAKSGN